MQLKSVLVSALLGVSTVVEASTIPTRSLVPRQRGGNRFGNNFQNGGGFGGGFGGNNNNNGDNQNGGNNNNNGGDNNNQDAAQDDAAQDGAAQDDAAQDNNNNNNNNNNDNGGNDAAAATCLNADAVQTGSALDGQDGDAEEGQVASATDEANFINFCSGKTLTNGLQVQGGSCNGVVMGEMPGQNKMVSTIMLSPAHNDEIQANQDFDVQLRIDNLQAGFFTNPQTTYYSAPQQLSGDGVVIGHTHVTIQDLGGSLTPDQPLDASQFVFFKGINDAGDGNGLLSATVTGGLPAGNYRVCSMSGASNHQPVLMPVAQRGTQEDCNKFTVADNAGGNNNNNNDQNQNADDQNADNQNADNQNADNQNNQNGGNQNNQNGGNQNNQNGGNNNNSGSDNNNNDANSNDNQNNGNQNADANNADANDANANTGAGGSGGASAANAIGGIAAPQVEDSGNGDRPFSVNGDTFVNKSAAVERACAIQNNACADAVNGGTITGSTVGDCSNQESACVAELS